LTVREDSDPFDGVDDAVEVGSDLLSLRGRVGELVEEIEARAESEAYDPDAIVRALASEYAVGEEAIEVVLDVLLPDDVDARSALRDLESSSIEEILPASAVEGIDDSDVPEIDGDLDRSLPAGGTGDMASETIQVDPAELADDDREIDPEAIREIVDDEIIANGGPSDD